MPSDRTFVIVGATRAGAKVAGTLPEEDVAWRLVLMDAGHGFPLGGVAAVQGGAP